MGLPRIIWDTPPNNLDFPEQLTVWRPEPRVFRVQHTSDGGKTENLFRFRRAEFELELVSFTDDAFADELEAFWAFASRGEVFAFAFDRDDTIDTTIATSAVSKGDTVITLASTTGIAIDTKYRMRSAAGGLNEEIVEVDSIASPNVTLKAGTKFAYAIGDIFRSRFYYPSMQLPSDVRRFFNRLNITTHTLSMSAEEPL
jgi:hypothetical protein